MDVERRRAALAHEGGAGALARAHEPVLAQLPERLAHGVTADAEAAAELLFGGQSRAHGDASRRDLVLERGDDTAVERRVAIAPEFHQQRLPPHPRSPTLDRARSGG
jgi:hypothetical protein